MDGKRKRKERKGTEETKGTIPLRSKFLFTALSISAVRQLILVIGCELPLSVCRHAWLFRLLLLLLNWCGCVALIVIIITIHVHEQWQRSSRRRGDGWRLWRNAVVNVACLRRTTTRGLICCAVVRQITIPEPLERLAHTDDTRYTANYFKSFVID